MKSYTIGKKWNTDFCDVLPGCLADLTNHKLIIHKDIKSEKIDDVITVGKSKKVVHLILRNNHYDYLTEKKKEIGNESGVKTNLRLGNVEANGKTEVKFHNSKANKLDHKLPTIVLPFKSDYATKRINAKKNELFHDKNFNIVFKAQGKLIDLTRAARIKYSNKETKEEPNNKQETHRKEVSIQDTEGAIYLATCKICNRERINSKYIGESGRKLKERIKEHMRCNLNPNEISSAICQHSFRAHGCKPTESEWDFEILSIQKDTQQRKTFEAYLIHKMQPNLNRDAGVNILLTDVTLPYKKSERQRA